MDLVRLDQSLGLNRGTESPPTQSMSRRVNFAGIFRRGVRLVRQRTGLETSTIKHWLDRVFGKISGAATVTTQQKS